MSIIHCTLPVVSVQRTGTAPSPWCGGQSAGTAPCPWCSCQSAGTALSPCCSGQSAGLGGGTLWVSIFL